MKNIVILGFIFLLSFILLSQPAIRLTKDIHIKVEVRVFQNESFVEDLSINDFELWEDGISQKIEAVYHVKNNKIHRKEELRKFGPETSRHFYLFFEISEYTQKMDQALDHFVRNTLVSGDFLTVITPQNAYRMKSNTLNILPREELIRQFREILQKDALVGNAGYQNLVQELTAIAKTLVSFYENRENQEAVNPMFDNVYGTFSGSELLTRYTSLLDALEGLRKVDQERLLDVVEKLKPLYGKKNVYLFYQRDFIPNLSTKVMDYYTSLYQDRPLTYHNINYLAEYFTRDLSFDSEKVKQVFSDASIAIHFLFFSEPSRLIPGIRMQEDSQKMIAVFREIANATGGFVESTDNPRHLSRSGAFASDYYLLFYSPENYKQDGAFKNIKVDIKNKTYQVIHRSGYFAD